MFPSLFKRISNAWPSGSRDKNAVQELTPVESLTREFQDIPASRKAETRQARKYIVEQLLARGFKKTEVAAQLGVSRKTVYNILNS